MYIKPSLLESEKTTISPTKKYKTTAIIYDLQWIFFGNRIIRKIPNITCTKPVNMVDSNANIANPPSLQITSIKRKTNGVPIAIVFNILIAFN